MNINNHTVVVRFESYDRSVPEVLDSLNAHIVLAGQPRILIKPNLVNDAPHPVTTPADCCEAIIRYVKACSDADIIVAEGCGDAVLETDDIFDALGYRDLARRLGITLLDLNHAPVVKKENKHCPRFPTIYLPEIAFNSYIISVPVLKAHSLSQLSGTLKNMVGFAPPEYYSGHYGYWKKAVFHKDIHQAILDLNSYRTPDLSIMDASLGLVEHHLGGPQCNPPVSKLIGGFDPADIDRRAAELLGMDWRTVGHLADQAEDGHVTRRC